MREWIKILLAGVAGASISIFIGMIVAANYVGELKGRVNALDSEVIRATYDETLAEIDTRLNFVTDLETEIASLQDQVSTVTTRSTQNEDRLNTLRDSLFSYVREHSQDHNQQPEILTFKWDKYSSTRTMMIHASEGICFLSSVKQDASRITNLRNELAIGIDQRTGYWFLEGTQNTPMKQFDRVEYRQLQGTATCLKTP